MRTFIVLPLLVLFGGAGCSNPPLLPAPHHYVRLDSLLPLHPSWEQVRSLDREMARFRTAPQQAGPLQYEAYSAVPIFAPRTVAPANIAKERSQQIDLDARRYVESLRKSLTNANLSVLAGERRREQRQVNATVAARLAEEAKRVQAVNEVKIFAIKERLRSLVLRDIVVKSQIQDLAQARTSDLTPLRQAQSEHTAILQEAARLKAEDAALRALDLSQETGRKRDTFYREELARSKERLARRDEELRAEMQDKLNAAARQQSDTAIPPPADPALPPVDARATPLPLPKEPAVGFASAPARVQPVLTRQTVVWQSQRNAIINEIRMDTWKAVQQAAARRGWKLDPGPTAGSVDSTKEVASALRAEWQMGTTP